MVAEPAVDLLERAKSGDVEAFQSLFDIWGDLMTKTAWVLTGDRVQAERAVADAFAAAWAALPSLHSRRPFRSFLLSFLDPEQAPAALPEAPTAAAIGASGDRRIGALRYAAGMTAGEIAAATGSRVPGVLRAIRALAKQVGPDGARSLAVEAKGIEASDPVFDAIEARLRRAPVHERGRRIRMAPAEAFEVLVDPASVATWVSGPRRLRPSGRLRLGTRLTGPGRLGGRRTRDETVVTLALAGEALAWTTGSRPRFLPGAIEFRWSLRLESAPDGTDLVHRLDGVAFPPGPVGIALRRSFRKAEPELLRDMQRGLETLGTALEGRAQRLRHRDL
ncbi:MAG TPA: SRPBCC family protein [Actinomycetota bacterium]